MTKERKAEIMQQFATHEGDTGSPEVQIALLTERINHLNEHLKLNKKRSSFSSWSIADGWPSPRPA